MVPIIPLLLFTGYDLEIIVQNGNSYITLENGWIMFQVEEHKVTNYEQCLIVVIFFSNYLFLKNKIENMYTCMFREKGPFFDLFARRLKISSDNVTTVLGIAFT